MTRISKLPIRVIRVHPRRYAPLGQIRKVELAVEPVREASRSHGRARIQFHIRNHAFAHVITAMREGDILLSKTDRGFSLSKVLRIDPWPDDRGATAHLLLFKSTAARPSLDDVDQAAVFAWHAPIDRTALERDCEILGNRPVTEDELIGYYVFLKHTDFAAYMAEKGMSVEEVYDSAKSAYDEGNRLCDERKYELAIDAFSQAIDEFPGFFEAHDNRAFALMDLARYSEAAAGFGDSLRINPENPVAHFSLGECFLRLGEIEKAVEVFRECVAKWPEQRHHREYLQRAQSLASGNTKVGKPWWQFW